VASLTGGLRLPAEDESSEQPALRRYLDVIKERWRFIVLAIVLCTAAAGVYVLTASEVYDAHTDMLVTPVPNDQSQVLGLGLLRQATDPTRDVATASRLIDNAEVAARVKRDLRSSASVQSLLGQISVGPVANSSIVTITASAGSARRAREVANAFGTAAVEERTEQLHRALDPAIRIMQARIKGITGNTDPAAANSATQPLFQQLVSM
jgi:tyrosine-protein kinase